MKPFVAVLALGLSAGAFAAAPPAPGALSETLIQSAQVHAAAGEEGEARLAWARARLVAPRDPRVRAAVGDAGPPLLRELSPDEWSVVALGFGGLACLALFGALWGRRARLCRGALLGASLACAASVAAAAVMAPSSDAAVVLQPAVARISPYERAAEAFSAAEGSLVELEREHGDWVRVRSNGGAGWLPRGDVERIVSPGRG